MSRTVTADTLNDVMEFDHVIRVHADGSVSDVDGIYAPNLQDGELDDKSWSLMNGYSGQYGYSGPEMHASEYIGGGMARDILATPGLYVAIVAYHGDDEDPTEWAVAYKLDDA